MTFLYINVRQVRWVWHYREQESYRLKSFESKARRSAVSHGPDSNYESDRSDRSAGFEKKSERTKWVGQV